MVYVRVATEYSLRVREQIMIRYYLVGSWVGAILVLFWPSLFPIGDTRVEVRQA